MVRKNRQKVTLALGVVCAEQNSNWRQRLRSLYGKWSGRGLLVRFVLDIQYIDLLRKRKELLGDEVSCWCHCLHCERAKCPEAPLDPACWQVGVPVRAPPSRAHCVEKAFGWWRMALRWPAAYYAKVDDDTVLSVPHLLALLTLLPESAVYAGAGAFLLA